MSVEVAKESDLRGVRKVENAHLENGKERNLTVG
jgi:hypothetical protein